MSWKKELKSTVSKFELKNTVSDFYDKISVLVKPNLRILNLPIEGNISANGREYCEKKS